MLIKILGILDILTAISFWIFSIFGMLPSGIVLFFAVYLIVKGIIFLISLNIASVLDIIIALVMFLSLSVHIPSAIVVIFTFILIQKGIISLF